MHQTNPFQSERLEYRGYDPAQHDDFFATMQREPLALVSSSASVLRPVAAKAIEESRTELLEKSLLFVIVCQRDPDPTKTTPIGIVSLSASDPDMAHHRCASLAIDIARDEQGRGYGGEVLQWVLAWAFEKAGLHRVELEYLGWNERVRPLYERAGFVEEGRRRSCYFKDGRWWDEVSMGILEDEWKARSQTAGQS
ncbi:Acyl-CoA N-acyltransferase [Cordyceps militaris CM01]|uniref:Acyl-CoA N-acyltransferase n=1 Tax=Cordyceps militaris (strain CM01) TaxID=983644 RepID=G3JP13_CORMM|nr:Acyl-CoA N-acyltransferase [Cordyceps militaris CM01]EGX89623.1 Acyl-CoA N-acyltransferase [Cordyceps militaris CM01]